MKVLYVCVCVALLAALCQAETVNEAIDPAIPRDKCGVSIGITEDEKTVLFVLGKNRDFLSAVYDPDTNEHTWTSLEGSFKGGPSVVRTNDGRLAVFGRAQDKQIWHKYQIEPSNLQWTTWEVLGHPSGFSSDPVAILSSEGFIHLFAKGADNSLMHKTQYTNDTLYTWTEWTSLGGSLTSQPAVMLDAEGLIHIFVRGPDRALWHKHQIGGQEPRFVKWSEWQSLGGVLASAPRVPIALNSVNLLEIFVRASDKAYWHRTQLASLPPNERELLWDDWKSVGGVFSSGPSAAVNGDGLIEAYGRGADKAIWYKRQLLEQGIPTWSKWETLHGITSTGPAVRVRSEGLLDIFVRGVDKGIWVKSQKQPVNGTVQFDTWKSVGHGVITEAFAC